MNKTNIVGGILIAVLSVSAFSLAYTPKDESKALASQKLNEVNIKKAEGIASPDFIPFPEFNVQKVTLLENSKTAGKKTFEIEFTTRSMGKDYPLVEGRDGFISLVGTTEKFYNVEGSESKVSVLKEDPYYSEYQLIQYVEVDAAEVGFYSGNISHDGRLWLIDLSTLIPTDWEAPAKNEIEKAYKEAWKQVPKGDYTDPSFLRSLATFFENRQDIRGAIKAYYDDNPNNLPMTYTSDGRPLAPGYNSHTTGDGTDPTYLRALADWYANKNK